MAKHRLEIIPLSLSGGQEALSGAFEMVSVAPAFSQEAAGNIARAVKMAPKQTRALYKEVAEPSRWRQRAALKGLFEIGEAGTPNRERQKAAFKVAAKTASPEVRATIARLIDS